MIRPDPVLTLRSTLLGAWSLTSYVSPAIDPQYPTIYPASRNATGLLLYTHDGYMSAQIMPPTERGPITDEEPEFRFDYFAYTGPFELVMGNDGKPNLTHEMWVTDVKPWLGMRQVRLVEVVGDELTLMGKEPGLDNSTGTPILRNPTLKWKKLPVHLPEENSKCRFKGKGKEKEKCNGKNVPKGKDKKNKGRGKGKGKVGKW